MVGVLVMLIGTILVPIESLELWAEDLVVIAAPLAAGTITHTAIFQTLFLAPLRRDLYMKRYVLRLLLERLKKLPSPSKPSQRYEVFRKKAEETWHSQEVRLSDPEILKFRNFFLLPAAFLFFIITSAFKCPLQWMLPSKSSYLLLILFFFVALVLLFRAIILHVSFIDLFKVLFPPEGRAKLKIYKVDDKVFSGQTIELPSQKNYVDMFVSFEGSVTNGFVDTLVVFDNDKNVPYPDPESYIGHFDYKDERIRVVAIYDTGFLQGRWENSETKREIRFYVKPDPACPYPFLGQTVKQLDIGLYEDPLFQPSREPRGGLAEQPEKIRIPLAIEIIDFV